MKYFAQQLYIMHIIFIIIVSQMEQQLTIRFNTRNFYFLNFSYSRKNL